MPTSRCPVVTLCRDRCLKFRYTTPILHWFSGLPQRPGGWESSSLYGHRLMSGYGWSTAVTARYCWIYWLRKGFPGDGWCLPTPLANAPAAQILFKLVHQQSSFPSSPHYCFLQLKTKPDAGHQLDEDNMQKGGLHCHPRISHGWWHRVKGTWTCLPMRSMSHLDPAPKNQKICVKMHDTGMPELQKLLHRERIRIKTGRSGGWIFAEVDTRMKGEMAPVTEIQRVGPKLSLVRSIHLRDLQPSELYSPLHSIYLVDAEVEPEVGFPLISFTGLASLFPLHAAWLGSRPPPTSRLRIRVKRKFLVPGRSSNPGWL